MASKKTKTSPSAPIMGIENYFAHGTHPFENVTFERRDALIEGADEKPVFEQREVSFPAEWSQNATNIVAQKYFAGQLGSEDREWSVKQLIGRVVEKIGSEGKKRGYFDDSYQQQMFEHELAHILVHQMAAFNSPVWFNIGVKGVDQQCSACQPYHALVSTPQGMVPIGEIVDGDQVGRKVYDRHGETEVVATKANGTKEVFRLVLRNGQFIEATADHQIFVHSPEKPEGAWMELAQAEVGMALQLHTQKARHAASVPQPVPAGGRFEFIPDVDPALFEVSDSKLVAEAALAGWLQADGFVGQYQKGTNRSLTIEFQVATPAEKTWVLDNLAVALPDVHYKIRQADTQDKPVERIRLYGEVLRSFVDRWGLMARRTDIRVPVQLFESSQDAISAYLRSLFQADGFAIESGKRVGFSVISEQWTEDVQLLLLLLGIYSKRRMNQDARDDRENMWQVDICFASERAKFAELIGFIDSAKQERLISGLQNLYRPQRVKAVRQEEIVSIVSLGDMPVYDIQTESGEYLSNNIVVHNCFILHIEDSLPDITRWYAEEAKIFQNGSGSGLNLSALRSSAEPLSRGGHSSGPVTFMRAADSSAGTITSGGRTRRAAKMVVLDVDHPDVEDFIWCKAEEEKKARALAAAGFDMSLNTPEGERNWASLQYQNANNSVRLSDEFLKAVEKDADFQLTARSTGEPVKTVKARELLYQIAEAAWECADPGVQYDTTINAWHTCPNHSRITASNPCSEYMHVDNSSCNLASLNLMKFRREDGTFNVEAFKRAVDVVFTAQEILISFADYPTREIGKNTRAMRQIGLGYANLGAYLMASGVPYDSEEGRNIAGAITALMHSEAYAQSARIAERMGSYDEFNANMDAQLRVIKRHRTAANKLEAVDTDPELTREAKRAAREMVSLAEKHGVRNAQVSVQAPTGTISFLMDCDTTGVEPDFSLVKYKKLVGGGSMTIVNQTVPQALQRLGYDPQQSAEIVDYIRENNSVVGAPHLSEDDYPVFDTAIGQRAISYQGHLKMMAAIQPFISGAISKTVNLPSEVTREDIFDIYLEAWKMGLKAVAIYRDGTKTAQPLGDGSESDDEEAITSLLGDGLLRGQRRRVPDDGSAIKRRFTINSPSSGKVSGHIVVGLFEDGTPGEVFVNVAQAGSTLRGFIDTWSRLFSMALQYGAPLDELVAKQAFTQFEPAGFTNDQEIARAKSIPDYVVRWMAARFLDEDTHMMLGINRPDVASEDDESDDEDLSESQEVRPEIRVSSQTAPIRPKTTSPQAGTGTCAKCGGLTVQTGKCMTCTSCGDTGGCG